MKKISKKSELIEIDIPEEVKIKMGSLIDLYDENYGDSRNIESDDGGFILLMEDSTDFARYVEMNHFIDYSVPEYVDEIPVANGKWYDALFILSSDFAISIITNEATVPAEIFIEWGAYE